MSESFERIKQTFRAYSRAVDAYEELLHQPEIGSEACKTAYEKFYAMGERIKKEAQYGALTKEEKAAIAKIKADNFLDKGMREIRKIGTHVISEEAVRDMKSVAIYTPAGPAVEIEAQSSSATFFGSNVFELPKPQYGEEVINHLSYL